MCVSNSYSDTSVGSIYVTRSFTPQISVEVPVPVVLDLPGQADQELTL